MNCSKIMDLVYEHEDPMPLFNQAQVWIHTLFCPSCAQKIERLIETRNIMKEDFFPPSPGLEDSIMAKVALEEELPQTVSAGGLSTRGWVIAGLIIFISLATAFFGFDFKRIVGETGTSFLIPASITIGIVLTTYGAFFIGSHLKELSERFGL
jgi:hypothetical protein